MSGDHGAVVQHCDRAAEALNRAHKAMRVQGINVGTMTWPNMPDEGYGSGLSVREPEREREA